MVCFTILCFVRFRSKVFWIRIQCRHRWRWAHPRDISGLFDWANSSVTEICAMKRDRKSIWLTSVDLWMLYESVFVAHKMEHQTDCRLDFVDGFLWNRNSNIDFVRESEMTQFPAAIAPPLTFMTFWLFPNAVTQYNTDNSNQQPSIDLFVCKWFIQLYFAFVPGWFSIHDFSTSNRLDRYSR